MDEIVIALFCSRRQLVLGIGENARNGNCKRTEEQYRSGSESCGNCAVLVIVAERRLSPAFQGQAAFLN